MIDHTARQIDAVHDVAPLIRPAHLHQTAIAAVQFQKVIGLQDHVVKLKKRQALLAVKPRLDRFKRQHPVDREVFADVAQKADVVQLIQPFGIVDQDGIAWPIAKGDIGRKGAFDAGNVVINLRIGQQRPLIGAKRRIADLGGAAPHQNNRLAAAFLQPAQHHDLDQASHMKRLGCGVKTDIARHDPVQKGLIQGLIIGAIGQKAALDHHAHKVGFRMVGHGGLVH